MEMEFKYSTKNLSIKAHFSKDSDMKKGYIRIGIVMFIMEDGNLASCMERAFSKVQVLFILALL